jgi:P2 family phage contractile tail tube protein
MATSLELTKGFQVAAMSIFFDGDPMPYIAEVKVPGVSSATETFDNTSTGGEIEVANPWRRQPDGDGEVKVESMDGRLLGKLMDATKLQSFKIAIAQNSLNPQLGQFLPMPVTYTIGAQFYAVDDGTIKQGAKRELTAKFKMLSYKVDVNFLNVIDFDFVNSKFKIDSVDLLSAVQNILGG